MELRAYKLRETGFQIHPFMVLVVNMIRLGLHPDIIGERLVLVTKLMMLRLIALQMALYWRI